MKRTFAACLLSAALPLSSALLAQDPPQPPEGSAPSSPPAGNANDTGTGPYETPDQPLGTTDSAEFCIIEKITPEDESKSGCFFRDHLSGFGASVVHRGAILSFNF